MNPTTLTQKQITRLIESTREDIDTLTGQRSAAVTVIDKNRVEVQIRTRKAIIDKLLTLKDKE